jgi:CRP-like cAMP-binding protein
MQIENEIFIFTNSQKPISFKAALSDLQIQYLAQLENKFTIKDLTLNGLKNGWLINFEQLYDLVQKIVQFKLIVNKIIYDYFFEIKNNTAPSAAVKPVISMKPVASKKNNIELMKLPFLRSLEPDVANRLLEESEVLVYNPESYICKTGEVFSRYLYILLSGQAAIYGQGQQTKKFVRLLGENSVFGEMGFFLGVPRTADIVAIKQSKVLVITGHASFMEQYLNTDKAQQLVHRFWIQQALLNSEIFKNIPSESIDELTFGGEIVKIGENKVLFNEGDLTNGAYIVVQGHFSVMINQKVIAQIPQGQMIGEMSLFQTQGKRSATVFCTKDSVLMHINLQKFYQLLSQNLYLAKTLQELSKKRFDENQKRAN